MTTTLIADRFRIEEHVGTGATGKVYRAVQEPLDRPVALKLLDPDLADDPAARRRFFREARGAARLNHPNVAHVLDFGETDEFQLFMALEWVPGDSMEAWREDPPELGVLLRMFDQLLHGLAAAHGSNVLHRNLKPANLLLHGDVQRPSRLAITDFGMAVIADGPSGSSMDALGFDPIYAAPEQIHQKRPASPETDLYAVGLLLYEMLSGKPPFTGAPRDVMRMHVEAPVPDLVPRAGYAVSDALLAVIERALRKEPDHRFRSAAEMRKTLRDVGPGEADEDSTIDGPALGEVLFGRDTELRELRHVAYECLHRPETRVVMLSGPMGTGKTTLAQVMGAEQVQRGLMSRVRARCSDEGLSNSGFAAVLEDLLGIRGCSRDEARRRLDGRPDLSSLLGGTGADDILDDLRPPIADTLILDLDDSSGGRPSRFARVLRAAAEARPTMVVLDDMHRAPMDDLDVLQHLVALDVGDPRPLLVITCLDKQGWRTDAPHRQLLERLRDAHEGVQEIEVGPLSTRACQEMLAEKVDAGPAFAQAVVDHVGTNPRIALAVAELAVASGHTREENGHQELIDADALAGQVPDDVRSLIRARIDEAVANYGDGQLALRVMVAAAVWGSRFDPDGVAELAVRAGLVDTKDRVYHAFEHLVRTGLLEYRGRVEDDRLAFTTRLLRREVLNLLRASTRRTLHKEAAALLKESGGGTRLHRVRAIAHHLFEGGLADEGRVFLRRAAELAETGWLLDQAESLYRELLGHLERDEPEALARTRLALGRIHVRQGREDEARELLVDLPETSAGQVAAEASLMLADLALTVGNASEASAWLMLARENLADTGPFAEWLEGERALLQERLLRARGDQPGRVAHLRDTIEGLGEGLHRLRAQERLAMALARHGEMDEGVALLDELEATLPDDAPPPLRVDITLDRAILADIRGDSAEARERYRQVLERAREAGEPERVSQAMVGLAELARFRDDLTRAEILYRDALAIQRRMGHQRFIAITLVNLCMVALARDDLDEASGFLDEVAALGADVSHPEVAVVYAFSRALIAGRRGDLEEARSEVYRFQAVNARVRLHEPDIANALEELSQRFREDGDEMFADELLHETLTMWRQLGRDDKAQEVETRVQGGDG